MYHQLHRHSIATVRGMCEITIILGLFFKIQSKSDVERMKDPIIEGRTFMKTIDVALVTQS